MILFRHIVAADTSIATGKNDAETPLLSNKVFLSKVSIVGRITGDNESVALINDLDRLVVTSDNGQNIVVHNELGAANLVALRNSDARSAVEGAVVAHSMKLVLSGVALNGFLEVSKSLLGANNSGSLATGSSLNMGDEGQKSVLVIRTGDREVNNSAHLLGSSRNPEVVDIIEKSLLNRLRNASNKLVEVYATRKNAVEFLIDSDALSGGSDSGLSAAAESLSTDTLSTVRNVGHLKENGIFDNEYILVTFSDVTEFYECIEKFILFY